MKSASALEGWFIRLDPGEEIPRDLVLAAAELGVTTASVTGIGAIDRAVLGFWDLKEHRYVETVVEEGRGRVLHGEHRAHGRRAVPSRARGREPA